MSIFLERDFSNGDIPFGMGVSDSDDDDDDDWIGGRELIQGDAKALTIWCLESRRTTHSQVVVNISTGRLREINCNSFGGAHRSERGV